MKTTPVLLLLFTLFASCDQKREEAQKSVYDAVQRIVYLHDQAYRARDIYTYSLSWAFRPHVESPELLGQAVSPASSAVDPGIKTPAYDSIQSGITLLSELAGQVMQDLKPTDSLYGPDKLYLPAVFQVQQRVDKEMSGQFEIVTAVIQRQLKVEQQLLDSIMAGKTLREEMTNTVTAHLEWLETTWRVREVNLDIYGGAMSWVYRGYDHRSKQDNAKARDMLTRSLDRPLAPEGKAKPMDSFSQAHIKEILAIDELIKANREICLKNVTTMVKAKEYEDPATYFLAEVYIEGDLAPHAAEIARLSTPLLRERIAQLMKILGDGQGQK